MDLQGLVVGELAELSEMTHGGDEQVSRGVGELVQQDERVRPAVHDEAFLVGPLVREAEDAALLLVGAADVLEPPGSPERTHEAACIRPRYRVGRCIPSVNRAGLQCSSQSWSPWAAPRRRGVPRPADRVLRAVTQTIVGTPANDVITGTPGNDVIKAGRRRRHGRRRRGATTSSAARTATTRSSAARATMRSPATTETIRLDGGEDPDGEDFDIAFFH